MYQTLIEQSEAALEKAKQTTDLNLKLFYLRVAKGYEMKAKNLTLGEACNG